MGSIVLRYILKHIRYWVKKNRSVETTAANNGQKKKLALKSQNADADTDTDGHDVNGADPAENQTRRILLKLNSKEMKWTPGHIHALLCRVSCVFLGRPN